MNNNILSFISKRKQSPENDWISVSDLMSVLMMIFLFIAISYMRNIQESQFRIKKIAVAYQELQEDLYEDLYDEFKNDLPKWQATLDKATLSIRFEEPEVLFKVGSSEVTNTFRNILSDFFPRYISILSSDKYRDNIEEIRIEGHTSSEWEGENNELQAYFNNMKLSQDRTRVVLSYCLNLIQKDDLKLWARKYLTANGLSSSRLILESTGIEDKSKSRRVEFRTKTNAERKVVEIVEEMQRK